MTYDQPMKKKSRRWPWIVGGIVAVIIVIAAASNGGTQPGPPATGAPAGNEAAAPAKQEPPKPTTHTVVYKVAGTAKTASNVTYTTDGATTMNQESNVKLPWEKTLTLPADEAFQMVSILAQGPGKGTIDVTITVDGKVIKEAHADGYGVASANENIGSLG